MVGTIEHSLQGNRLPQKGVEMVYGYMPYQISPFRFMTYPIGERYRYLSVRLLFYLSFAVFLIVSIFLVLGISGKATFLRQNFPLVCTLSLHLSLVFTFSHIFTDIVTNQMKLNGMTYDSRTIGRQWFVVYTGLIMGFSVHQFIFPRLFNLYNIDPSVRFPISLWIMPLFCASVYSNILTVLISQNRERLTTRERAPTSSVTFRSVKPEKTNLQAAHQNKPKKIRFQINGKNMEILHDHISHISMEDHYGRIYYKNGNKLESILVRRSLKQLLENLGRNDFIQIHRSHLVNRKHIADYRRKGRKHSLILALSKKALPISRRRQREVKDALIEQL